MVNKKTEITIGYKKIVVGVITSILIGAFSGVIGIIRLANSDHFTIVANAKRLDNIEANYVHSDKYESDIKYITTALNEIKTSDKEIFDYLIRL